MAVGICTSETRSRRPLIAARSCVLPSGPPPAHTASWSATPGHCQQLKCQCTLARSYTQPIFFHRQDVKGGNGTSADVAASKALSTRKPRRGVALQELLKLLLSIAGPKILALVGLALARTALSNRLARLQV